MAAGIRLAAAGDAAPIAAIYAPFCEGTRVSFELTAPSPAEMAGRIEAVTRERPWLVLESDGRVAGYAYATGHRDRAAYRWAVDLAVYVAAGQRGRRIGRALYVALAQALVVQGYYKAYAGITLPNPASVRLHESVGFTPVGIYRGVGYKLGAWCDVAWYQLVLRPEAPDPEPPRPLPEVLGTAGWSAAMAAGVAELGGDARIREHRTVRS